MNDRAKARRVVRRAGGTPLQSAYDRLPVGFALFDADLRLAAWNARFATLRAYPRRLVKAGTPLESFVRIDAERGEYGPGAPDALMRDRLAVLKRRRRVEHEHAPAGGRSVRIVAEQVPEGGLLVTCADVTEARDAAERLRQSEERYDFAMRAVNEGLYDWDIVNDTVHYSDRVYQAVGMSPDDYTTAAGWYERIHPDDQRSYRDALRAHFKGETDRFELDYRYRARDGSWHWARQHGLAVRNASGRAVRLIGSTGNITELKERERELAEQVAEQTAVRGLLEAISHSAFDLDAVLRTLIETATRLCHADKGFIFRLEGDAYHLAIDYGGVTPEFRDFEARHPMRPGRDTLVGRTALTKQVVHLPDVLADTEYRFFESQRLGGFRTMLGVPIVRDAVVIGVIALWKERVEPFTPAQVQLVSTFSSQAAIAIENARLFSETTEALARQTAMADILRVISSSPTSTEPVFDAILESGTHLCEADLGILFRYEAGVFQAVATRGVNSEFDAYLRAPFHAGPKTGLGRIASSKAPVQIPDLLNDVAYREGDPLRMKSVQLGGVRTWLGVPMLREGDLIGAFAVYRKEVRPFDDRQTGLLRTFADQAVIAIENVRLFNALQTRNRELTGALEREKATAEVLRVISGSPTDIQPVLDAVAERAGRLCDAPYANVMLVEGDELLVRSVYSTEPGPTPDQRNFVPLRRSFVNARAVLDREVIHHADVVPLIDTEYPDIRRNQEKFGFRAMLVVPLMREGKAIGTIFLWRREVGRFSPDQVALLQTFADQAVIAIENVRLFEALQARNRELTEALEQQTATAEILRVISSSPTDLAPVFDAVARSAARLCDTPDVVIIRAEGESMRFAASVGPFGRTFGPDFSLPITRGSVAGRAVVERRTIQVHDLAAEPEHEYPIGRTLQRRYGHRTMVAAPLLLGDAAIGAIAMLRREAKPFTDKQVALLQTFADQAVIAIQNVRLFNETKEALEQQRATADVLSSISGSPTDTQPVFERIVKNVCQLFGTRFAVLQLLHEDMVEMPAVDGDPGFERLRDRYPRPLDDSTVGGRAMLSKKTVQFAPVLDNPATPPATLQFARDFGFNSVIFTPMIHEGKVIGAIGAAYPEAKGFDERYIELIRSFADQAVIAIQNVRLFNEIREKSRQLEIANQHKSAFLANMSHELRTPLNAVIGFSEMLAARYFGDLTEKQAEYVSDIHASGKHLLSLINDILDLSKIEAGRMELEAVEFDLRAALDNALTLVRERAQRGGVALRLDTGPDLGAFRGDERKLKQVVLNLLSNAVKFTPRGGAVDVFARRADGAVEIAVRDTGAGIAPEDHEAIFEAFRQVGTDVTRKREGTGLGLALTRRFVELHGGTIRVESALGKGSTFTVRLPTRHGE